MQPDASPVQHFSPQLSTLSLGAGQSSEHPAAINSDWLLMVVANDSTFSISSLILLMASSGWW
jgi:hypothetical protein